MWLRSTALILILQSHPAAAAEPFACEAGQITVITEKPDVADKVCGMSRHGLSTLAQCGIRLELPLTIRTFDTLPTGCLGLYHCGKDTIDLLEPDAMSAERPPGSILAYLDDDTYFRSILTHELAHAAYDGVWCPFETCVASAEYLAHNFQIMSLPDEDIKTFEAHLDIETPVSQESVNAMMYFLAPENFLRRSWIHLSQREDSCQFLDQVAKGRVFFDAVFP